MKEKMPYFPANRVAIRTVFVLLAFIAAGVVFYAFGQEKEHETATGVAENQKEFAKKDSDNDGVEDWEETIRGSDPYNPDTDGDGATDGAEIAENRDPLKPGPDDALVPKKKTSAAAEKNLKNIFLNAGTNVTATLIGRLLEKNGPEGLLDEKNYTTISTEVLSLTQGLSRHLDEILDATPRPPVAVIDDSSEAAIFTYFESVATLYEKYIFGLGKDDTEFLVEALKTQSPKPLAALARYRKNVDALSEEIARLAVPQTLVAIHEKELNYLAKTSHEFGLMESANPEDPLFILALLNLRIELKKEVSAFHGNEIPAWLAKRGIAFGNSSKASRVYKTL